MGCSKSYSERNVHSQKPQETKSQTTLHLKELEKEQSRPKVSRKKGKHIHKHISVHVYICTYTENTVERQHR